MITLLSGLVSAQALATAAQASDGTTADVAIVAFDLQGDFLGPPEILRFESTDGTKLAKRFHAGEAKRIPFGRYVIEARITG